MSNVYEFQDSNTIEEQAAAWLVKLDSDLQPTQEDLVAFRAWMERSPAHRIAIKKYARFWEQESILMELAIPLTTPAKQQRKPFFTNRKSSAWLFAGIGAVACTLVLSLYLVLFNSAQSQKNGFYSTMIGEQQTQILADGSLLQMNTNSQVQVDYSEQRRVIRLMKGEAHFDVVPDPKRPFEVYAGNDIVRAVGTAFSVYLTPKNVKVTVSKGKVALETVKEPSLPGPGKSINSESDNNKHLTQFPQSPEPVHELLGSLEAGQSAVISSAIEEIKTLPETELERQMSWRNGLLVFAGNPLSEVVDEINRYTHMTVEIADPALRDIEIGGRFKQEDLEGILDVLQINFGIQVSRLDDQLIQLHAARDH